MGFFLNWENAISVLPGLPNIEVGNLYIILALVKAFQKKQRSFNPFYSSVLKILFVYLVFLVIVGQAWGLSNDLNVQFRILKLVLPCLLLYIVPILLEKENKYYEFMGYLFPFAILTFMAQIFTIRYGVSPAVFIGSEGLESTLYSLKSTGIYRGFYSTQIVLITFFGSVLLLNVKQKYFSVPYLYLVCLLNFGTVYLSATRGWIIAFAFMLICHLGFMLFRSPKQLTYGAVLSIVLILILTSFSVTRNQVSHSFERLKSLQYLYEGDITAGSTLSRLSERGPKVMKEWRESPLIGFGFSDKFFEYHDMHVGNQTLLLHSGLIGFGLLIYALIQFNLQLIKRWITLPSSSPNKQILIVFVVGTCALLIIHSSSVQVFSYYFPRPEKAIVIAVFFSLAALMYKNSFGKVVTQGRLKQTRNQIR